MKISAQFIEMPDTFHITPGLSLVFLSCENPRCRAWHGTVVDFHWLGFSFGIVISPEGKAE